MTAPIAAKKAATKVAAKKAAPKKYASTRPGPNAAVPKKETPKKASPTKRTAKKAVQATKNTTQKQARYYAPIQRPVKSVVTYRHILAVEYIVGMIVIMTQTKDFKKGDQGTINVLLQAASFTFGWAILFFITSGGRTAARFSSALGGLIVLTLVVKQGNIFDRFSAIYKGTPGLLPDTPGNTEGIILGPLPNQPPSAVTPGQQPNPNTDLGGLVGLGPSGFGD